MEMTEKQKELAAKPQSDWDGYIIPQCINY
jgi:hypothetical protein